MNNIIAAIVGVLWIGLWIVIGAPFIIILLYMFGIIH
jgi:hypothetical protein